MRKMILPACLLFLLYSCGNKQKNIVNAVFTDSLIDHYTTSTTADSNLIFWEKRMAVQNENFVTGPKYASALISRFRLSGNIHDLLKADSLYKESNLANQEKEPGILRTLVSLAMLQHKFSLADTLLKKAIRIEGNSLANAFLDFDISFERGEYGHCKKILPSLSAYNLYGYLFRRSKMEHYDGSLDSSVSCMLQAAEQAGNNIYFKQSALSNAADLYIHKGDLSKAYDLYTESIKLDASDLHSMLGIGWIALIHDKNDPLANKIFHFVQTRSNAPDILLKLEQLAEARADTAAQKEWATRFAVLADQPVYGLMYSKYLIDLYTGILNDPPKAVRLAEKEIINRPTPQTYAWYVWALYCNNEKENAYSNFRAYVSGKPLEGPELYYMGKMMQGMNKGYNAQQFFKAAYKNRYDLGPAKQKDLEENLE